VARSPQPLSRILAADPAIAGWDARRRRDDALGAVVRRHLPRPLAERVRVTDAGGGQLDLAVDSGAVAAVVRQRSPDLAVALRREGYEFTGIRVRVQVRTTPAPKRKILPNQPNRDSTRPLAELARGLPAGPLKAALARLLRRIG
jgi:hypothetical protein